MKSLCIVVSLEHTEGATVKELVSPADNEVEGGETMDSEYCTCALKNTCTVEGLIQAIKT